MPHTHTRPDWNISKWIELLGGLVRQRADVVDDLDHVQHADDARKVEYVAGFVDEAGFCRPCDRLVLAWRLGLDANAVGLAGQGVLKNRGDWTLWETLTRWNQHQQRRVLDDPLLDRLSRGDGPMLCRELRCDGIEVWTEAELAGLQALWWLAWMAEDATERQLLIDRAHAHHQWMTRELSPDNATNRPWGLAAFAAHGAIGQADSRNDAAHYAQTLVHICQVQLGRPDRFSTVLLLDAIDWLQRFGSPMLTGRERV